MQFQFRHLINGLDCGTHPSCTKRALRLPTELSVSVLPASQTAGTVRPHSFPLVPITYAFWALHSYRRFITLGARALLYRRHGPNLTTTDRASHETSASMELYKLKEHDVKSVFCQSTPLSDGASRCLQVPRPALFIQSSINMNVSKKQWRNGQRKCVSVPLCLRQMFCTINI
jgi:hypothetical protein